ncbi:MAG: DUF1830 domain-containing protein [Leptolyngbyaceae bacterium]|nr:DUF1830 domain-containing protein [Leptolyngbyaceae bacterium]
MTQILDALPSQHSNKILCGYHNRSPDLKIARITNISNWYFERVIFPDDVLIFEAIAEATLEIYSSDGVATLLSDHLPCEKLRI